MSRSMRWELMLMPLVCKYCPRTFHDTNRWMTHLRTHKVRIQSYWYRAKYKNVEEAIVPIEISRTNYQNTELLHYDYEQYDYFGMHMNDKNLPVLTSKTTQRKRRKKTDLKEKFICGVCGRELVSANNLKRHLLTHTNERPFSCQYCGRGFTQSHNLTIHERLVHTKEKPFNCPYCFKGFSRASDAKAHERLFHTKEQLYNCAICSKNFVNKSSFMVHEQIHTKVKPYSCQHCSKPFARSGDLKKHERIHTNEKPYTCQYCSKTFSSSSCIRRHEWTHTKQKQYSCSHCHKGFSRLYYAREHEEKEHGSHQEPICDPSHQNDMLEAGVNSELLV